MSDKYRVYVFADADLIDVAVEGVKTTGTCVCVGRTSLLRDAEFHLSQKPADLIVVEVNANSASSCAITELLNKKKIPFVALCPNAGVGFFALSKGAAKMIVVPPGFDLRRRGFIISSLALAITGVFQALESNYAAQLKNPNSEPFTKIVAIGASTGGSDAVTKILRKFPPNMPPVLAVLHMPPVFTGLFADQLNTSCQMTVCKGVWRLWPEATGTWF